MRSHRGNGALREWSPGAENTSSTASAETPMGAQKFVEFLKPEILRIRKERKSASLGGDRQLYSLKHASDHRAAAGRGRVEEQEA